MVAQTRMTHTVDFMSRYVRRVVDDELEELFDQLPAVLLDGPKGVGKTATARGWDPVEWNLDDPDQRAVVEADPKIVVASGNGQPVLVDEWQRVPAVFDAIRRAVDDDPTGGRFILTGSATSSAPTHSGAGRITTVRMRPLSLYERLVPGTATVSLAGLLAGDTAVSGEAGLELSDYVDEIVTGGFPGMRGLAQKARERQLDSYLDRIVDHELPELGFRVRHPTTVRAWLKAYGAAVGTTASWEKIRDAATPGSGDKPAKTTTMPYIELLTQLRILDPVDAWTPSFNHLQALTQSPKHHLADPALAARLVRLSAAKLIRSESPTLGIPRDGTYVGALFESLATLTVRVLAQRHGARVYHLRTRQGRHEVDLIVEGEDGVVGIECKLGGAVDDKDVTHLRWLKEQIGSDLIAAAVVTTGKRAYRRKDGVAVVPLALLGP